MRTEQKIILSLYYADPTVKDFDIDKAKFSIKMDITQLMFLMAGVFQKVDFKYHVADKKILIEPLESKRNEYDEMVKQTDQGLKKAGILSERNGISVDFDDTDYENIDALEESIDASKENLYFLNILVRSVNGTRLLEDRKNTMFYHLFSDRGGKECLYCVIAIMLKFVSAFQQGNHEAAEEVILALNEEFKSANKFFQKEAEAFLENMRSYEQNMHESYLEFFFVNESEIFATWLADHQSAMANGGILDFVFYKNQRLKNYMIHLMMHITKIARVFIKDDLKNLLWIKRMRSYKLPEMREFYYLDDLVEKLEKKGAETSFNAIDWAEEYKERLIAFALNAKLY